MSMMADFQRLMQPFDEACPESGAGGLGPESLRLGQAGFILAFQRANAALMDELIGRIHAQRPEFFEYLVIDVLLAMGYGGRRRDIAHRLGRTGDGGIDGLIAQDELGLDLIYI